MSGGEKQRVAVARAFINEPKVILADEPTASIDAKLGRQVVLMLKDLIKEKETAGVIVTHDDRILDLVDRVYHLENGQLKEAVLK